MTLASSYLFAKLTYCSAVILVPSFAPELEREAAQSLRELLGAGWSRTSAIQYMGGKTAKAAIEAVHDAKRRATFMYVHMLSKTIASKHDLGGFSKPDGLDAAQLQAWLIEGHQPS